MKKEQIILRKLVLATGLCVSDRHKESKCSRTQAKLKTKSFEDCSKLLHPLKSHA